MQKVRNVIVLDFVGSCPPFLKSFRAYRKLVNVVNKLTDLEFKNNKINFQLIVFSVLIATILYQNVFQLHVTVRF